MYLLNVCVCVCVCVCVREREREREREGRERERPLARKSNPLIFVNLMLGNIQPFDQYDYVTVN